MGATLAGVVGRPPLSDVLTALKNAKVLEGATFTTAQSYLKFRNDALHADWAQFVPSFPSLSASFANNRKSDSASAVA
jgi:hypothetical protein